MWATAKMTFGVMETGRPNVKGQMSNDLQKGRRDTLQSRRHVGNAKISGQTEYNVGGTRTGI